MQRLSGQSSIEGVLVDWVSVQAEPDPRLPAAWASDVQVAARLQQLERNRARDVAEEAELILRLAALRPDDDDPVPGSPGAPRAWRRTDPEFPGVSEFFPREVGHALNLGRGTAAFRARRAFIWRDKLPATFALLRRGEIDERRAGKLAEVLAHAAPELTRQVEARLLPEASSLAPGKLGGRALELLAELDADAIEERQAEAEQAADVRAWPTANGMGVLAGDMTAEQAAACHAMIDQLAWMAKADGDDRPIGQIRAEVLRLLILRPADSGLPRITIDLTVTATLDRQGALAGGVVNGFAVTASQLRELLTRFGALGLQAPAGGSLTVALTDEDGRLLATATAADLARLAATGCPDHPQDDADILRDGAGTGVVGCGCAVLGPPPDTDRYTPTAGQKTFVTTRDRTCRMPNCGQRVGWADHDHVVPHSRGGATSCTNLCCLCRSDHRLKTFAPRWRFRLDPDGTLHVTSPSGVTRTSRPPGLRPPEPPPSPDEADEPPPF
ncbi:HNH endonuclease signature motif containing protein [Modestobacter altitudinis]|uniref:HNH endonuclease signature motif containing protein n=1 Tax=Modestobacter altitudinis TaxID=2213158 RepID=UPI00110D0C30|nr:HNH endonuclease signature motif containing protein [Modestobacter altitudinis]